MVILRITRQATEALADSNPRAGVDRISTETAALDGGSGGKLRVTRQAVEVMFKVPPRVNVERISTETAALDGGTSKLRVTRQAMEVLILPPKTVEVERLTTEIAAFDGGISKLRVTRQAIELLGKAAVPPPVPLPAATTLDFFVNNWASQVDMESNYSTDVTRSPITLQEERRSLQQRPQRVMAFRWTRESKIEYDRLVVLLRRLTGENLQFPLFQDFANVTAAQAPTEKAVHCNAIHRRFFSGQRILVSQMPENGGFQPHSTAQILTIDLVFPTKITTIETPSQVFEPGDNWTVFPLIDCDEKLSTEHDDRTTELQDMGMELFEFRGKSALPPSAVGLPPGWTIQFGMPVLEIEPNWIDGVNTSYERYGVMQLQGRATKPHLEGDRYVQKQGLELLLERPDFWRVLNFFDTRRGRTLAFWTIDREFIWSVVAVNTSFIDITPLGDFADFNLLWTDPGLGAGFVMKDGTIHIRHINTVQATGGVWRLTLVGGETLPAIDVTQIDRFARARTTRFLRDTFRERWTTSEVTRVSISTVEVVEEQDIIIE